MTIRSEFRFNLFNEVGLNKQSQLEAIFSEALDKIEKLVPKSRPMSLVVTHMQDAHAWAQRALAEEPSNLEGA